MDEFIKTLITGLPNLGVAVIALWWLSQENRAWREYFMSRYERCDDEAIDALSADTETSQGRASGDFSDERSGTSPEEKSRNLD